MNHKELEQEREERNKDWEEKPDKDLTYQQKQWKERSFSYD